MAGAPAQGDDAYGARDVKAGQQLRNGGTDPRVLLLLSEAYRHAKALGAWGGGGEVLNAAGCPAEAPGVVVGDDARSVLHAVTSLLATHRVWDRFPPGPAMR